MWNYRIQFSNIWIKNKNWAKSYDFSKPIEDAKIWSEVKVKISQGAVFCGGDSKKQFDDFDDTITAKRFPFQSMSPPCLIWRAQSFCQCYATCRCNLIYMFLVKVCNSKFPELLWFYKLQRGSLKKWICCLPIYWNSRIVDEAYQPVDRGKGDDINQNHNISCDNVKVKVIICIKV